MAAIDPHDEESGNPHISSNAETMVLCVVISILFFIFGAAIFNR
jgi:hypothetical protein